MSLVTISLRFQPHLHFYYHNYTARTNYLISVRIALSNSYVPQELQPKDSLLDPLL
jgi:hypothetical protein